MKLPEENPAKLIYPNDVINTIFDDSEKINNTAGFLIKCYKPLTENQIQVLRDSGVRLLQASEIETIYHSLIEENKIEEVENLDFVEYVYPYKTKIEPTKEMVDKIVLLENGKKEQIDINSEGGLGIAITLTRKLHELNLQSTCVFGEEDIQEIEQKDRSIMLFFKKPIDITISQWVEPEERYHIPVDEKGYRILEDVETALFILEDNLDEGLEAHILVGADKDEKCYWEIPHTDVGNGPFEIGPCEGSVGYIFSEEYGCSPVFGCGYDPEIVPFVTQRECELACGRMWSCWAINIKEEGKPELDKTWIDGINKILTLEKSEEFCGVEEPIRVREEWQPMAEKISFWENGSEQIINPKSLEYIEMGRILLTTLHKLNLQAGCVFSEEGIQDIKRNHKVVEMVFKQADDFPISQWVKPEERYHIPVDEKGYRILEDVKTALFILEDRQNEGLEAHILVGHRVEGRVGYSCWAINIKEEGKPELDKTWIDGINRLVK